jgi:hypothetical protein
MLLHLEQLCIQQNHRYWELFYLPTMFQNHVMREDHLVTNQYIRDMFIGNHINFDVNLCTEVIERSYI